MNIVVYSKSNCPNCVTAKKLLRDKQLGYVEIDVERNPSTFARLLEQYPDARQMPQIVVNGQRIGGVEGLKANMQQIVAMWDDWK